MKILVVTQYFAPEVFRVNDLVAHFAAKGHEVTVLTGLPNYPHGKFYSGYGWRGPWREAYHGATVVRAPLTLRGNGGGLVLALNFVSFALCASLVALFRLRGPYDVIFVHEVSPITVGIPAIAARWRFRAPILFWVLDLWPESITAAGGVTSPWVLRPVARLVRWIYARCERVLAASRAFIPEFATHGVPPERIRYFPQWGESVFTALDEADMSKLPPLPTGFKVLFAGGMGEAQDWPAVLDAAERLQARTDIHWILVGDGRQEPWIRAEIARRGLAQMHLMGRHPLELMPHFFAAADVLLLPLKREPIFSLTIPAKLQSYLASARPIAAMLDGEGARIVREAQAGLACDAGDAAALAVNVEALFAMPVCERQHMGWRGREFHDTQFNAEALFQQLEDWMSEAAG
jgi:glycosyltransferase involved in cell wall biosynthesis